MELAHWIHGNTFHLVASKQQPKLHATIELTVSPYGRWLKKKAPGALDRMDISAEIASGSKVVAEAVSTTKMALPPLEQGLDLQALTMEPATRIERTGADLQLNVVVALKFRPTS